MRAGAAKAIRMGIHLGRLMAIDIALNVYASEPHASWRFVEPYRGIHQRAYRRAIDRAADRECARVIEIMAAK